MTPITKKEVEEALKLNHDYRKITPKAADVLDGAYEGSGPPPIF